MESQGASFGFNPAMDFSAAYATPQQQQLAKSSMEGSTSALFGDEGIDITTYMDPNMFNDIQEHTLVPSNIAIENTSESTSVWDTQLTPQLHHTLNTFPLIPAPSFNSMCQPNPGDSLGKRALQLDQLDTPLAKRHESMSNVIDSLDLFSSMPTNNSVTVSDWSLDKQFTPPVSTIELGLSDEAADVCATWFHKFNMLPSDRHIESLSQLTGESADAIRSWFGRLLKQGMGGSWNDSAYKSQTCLTPHESFWDGSHSSDTLQGSPSQFLLQQTDNITTPQAVQNLSTTIGQPAVTFRGKRKRCTPTNNLQLLSRDSSKIYQCTRKCGKRYGRKCDWKRNEEEGYPCKSWVCSLCTSEGVENVKPCFRKYHFAQHFRNIHPGVDPDDHEETSVICSQTEFPRLCGFCTHHFISRQDRIDHIAGHFKAGKCMFDWREEENSNGNESDQNDNNMDDGPSGDGFGNTDFLPPSSFNPRNGAETKFHEKDGGGSGSGGDSGCGLSPQPNPGHDRTQSQPTDQYLSEKYSCQNDRDQLSTPFGPEENILPGSLFETGSALGEQIQTEEDCQFYMGEYEPSQLDIEPDSLSLPSIEQQKDGQYLPSEVTDCQPSVHPENSGPIIIDEPIIARLGICSDISHDNGLASLNENRTPCPTDSDSFRGYDNCPGSLNDAPGSSTSLSALTSVFFQEILRKVPPNSQSFLSVKLLGAGGFSTVDEVIHRRTHLRLSRKTLKNRDQNAAREMRKEIDILQKLRHPHVIRFLDAYLRDDKMSILLSPVAETTLALWLERIELQKPADLLETIVKMFGCLISSVRYLHEQRPVIKHMDVKPQNILILDGDSALPQVILCDFGISSSEDLCDGHFMPVTRQYTAPEAFQGSGRKQAADIWSLGCVFAEMASVPFSQGNSGWVDFRKAFSGRIGKYYWQDIPEVQARLSTCLDEATTATEQTVARTLKSMLSPQPSERPDAASLAMIFTPAPCCLSWAKKDVFFPSPHDEMEQVEKLDSEVCVHDQHHTQDMTQEPTSDEVSIAERWMNDCSHSHSACRQSNSSDATILPRYLVDLHPNGQTEPYIRVVESVSIEQATKCLEYVALSQEWSHSQLLLSSSTISNLQSGLPLDQLPDALNKAIAITQRLGYRYVWADSLCVIQDSMREKQQQCKAMASIFRNAALTIVLDQLTANNTITTPPTQCPPRHPHSPPHALSSQPSRSHNHHNHHLPTTTFTSPGFAWDTRAWVLQERLLSRRFLHLGKQLYWECNQLKASATLPHGLSPLLWETIHTRRPNNPRACAEVQSRE